MLEPAITKTMNMIRTMFRELITDIASLTQRELLSKLDPEFTSCSFDLTNIMLGLNSTYKRNTRLLGVFGMEDFAGTLRAREEVVLGLSGIVSYKSYTLPDGAMVGEDKDERRQNDRKMKRARPIIQGPEDLAHTNVHALSWAHHGEMNDITFNFDKQSALEMLKQELADYELVYFDH